MIVEPFPPRPKRLVGRDSELSLLERLFADRPARAALVGGGGSGKTTLAAELVHRIGGWFSGGAHWFRVGAWDERVLAQMLGLRFGLPRRSLPDVARELRRGPNRLLVLDNHENDPAMAVLLNAIGPEAPVSIVITARRCLVAGVTVVPVVPPLVLAEAPPFPRVARLTRRLRSNPLGLEIADALVEAKVMTVQGLSSWLADHGIDRVRALDHEDDVPEVGLLVKLAWSKLGPLERRMLAVLSHMGGDHMDGESLQQLARARKSARAALERLRVLRLVQQPIAGRFTLHATVRHALGKTTRFEPAVLFDHYVTLLEREPARIRLEEAHLFAAMDHAHESGDLGKMLRVDELLAKLDKDERARRRRHRARSR